MYYPPGAFKGEIFAGMELKENPAIVKRILAALAVNKTASKADLDRSTRFSVTWQMWV